MDTNIQKIMAESALRKAIGALHAANNYNVETTKKDICFYIEWFESCTESAVTDNANTKETSGNGK